ncbi:MAG: DUF1415 family protein [Deltaproteobacteria bacterium]|nr:DUF1415 family protein [Deltaproteobacteria bacterium]
MTDPPTQAALARNDRYLASVVEAFGLCPFARQCRATGKLHRHVVAAGDQRAFLVQTLAELQATGDDGFEVALVLMPAFVGAASEFETLLREAETEVAAHLRAQGRQPACFAVVFHPGLPFASDQPHQLVGLLRRSPDPTVQLVRRSLLDRVRGTRGEHRYVDVDGVPRPGGGAGAGGGAGGRCPALGAHRPRQPRHVRRARR